MFVCGYYYVFIRLSEVIVDSHEGLRDNTKRSYVTFTWFPLMVVSPEQIVHCYNQNVEEIQNTSIIIRIPPVGLFINIPTFLPPWHPLLNLTMTNLFSVSLILSFQGGHINRTIWCAIFWDWLYSLSRVHVIKKKNVKRKKETRHSTTMLPSRYTSEHLSQRNKDFLETHLGCCIYQ